jgi:hypothetical protein
MEGVSYA